MPFEPGQKRAEGAGNPKGGTIKRSLAALQIAEENNVCPITFLCNVINDKYPDATFEHKLAAAKELAPYIFPKLKQVEHTGEVVDNFYGRLIEKLSAAPNA